MTFVVQHQSVLCDEALSAELTEVRFSLLLRWRRNLNDCGLLDLLILLLLLLLRNLDCLLLDNLLFNLRCSLLIMLLLVDLNLLVLLISVRWTL